MLKRIRKFWKWVLADVARSFDILTFVSALLAIIINTFSEPGTTYALFASVLSFGCGLYVKDVSSKKQYETLKNIERSLPSKVQFITRSVLRYPDMLAGCTELFISGSSLVRVSNDLPQIVDSVASDCNIRLVLVRPNTPASGLMAKFVLDSPEEQYNQQIEQAIAKTIMYIERYRETHHALNIELRQIEYCPPLGFFKTTKYAADGEKIEEIKAEIYFLATESPKRANLIYRSHARDYKTLNAQIEELWKRAQKIT